jgi:pimeloyl-ACP methyl ester carboxylesterase
MMPSATLHDGSTAEFTTRGSGPAILLPVNTTPIVGEAAEQMRQWGADPNLGQTLANRLAETFTVVACDYEGELARTPKPDTLTSGTLAGDLLAIADAAGLDRFAYYGYSWLALAGLQLAIRTDRLTALAMGGFPPLGGPYQAMLAVTEATYRAATEPRVEQKGPVVPGDWDSAEISVTEEQAKQYLTLYRSLRGFDERAALAGLSIPRLAFAGATDDIDYSPRWGGVRVEIGSALRRNQAELASFGWEVAVIDGLDHIGAMQAEPVLAILVPWLGRVVARPETVQAGRRNP